MEKSGHSNVDSFGFFDLGKVSTDANETAFRKHFGSFQLNLKTLKDPIYVFDLAEQRLLTKEDAGSVISEGESVIAGSAAIHFLAKQMGVKLEWEPNDTDVFLFNSVRAGRSQVGSVDLVASQMKTVIELFDSFDLPCTRVAYNSDFLFFTEQAARAILYKEYALSEFVLAEKLFEGALSQIEEPADRHKIYLKTRERLVKYKERGFHPVRIDISFGRPSFLAKRQLFSAYVLDPEEELEDAPSLVFDLKRYHFDQKHFLQHLSTLNNSRQVATWQLFPRLQDDLKKFLSPEYKIF
jgi:hypothetical protein